MNFDKYSINSQHHSLHFFHILNTHHPSFLDNAVLHMRMRDAAPEETQNTDGLENEYNPAVSINAIIEMDAANATSVMAKSLYIVGKISNPEENNGEKNRKTRKMRKQVWRELDISDLVTEARGQDWR